MPIYMVNTRNQRVQIPAGALSVAITGAVDNVMLDVQAGRDQPVVRSTAQVAVLPQLTGPVSIAVRPIGAGRFPGGTVVHLAIAHDTPDEIDPVQVVFDPVDVSGDTEVVFAELLPRGPEIEIGVSAVSDTALSPLAAAARTSARRVVGRGAAQSTGELVVALNSSASMRSWFADGTAPAAVDIVVGVADALGIRDVSVILVGADIAVLRAADGSAPTTAGLADAVRRTPRRWSAGVRWSALRPGIRTVVCTDTPVTAVPHNFPVLGLSNDATLRGPRLPAPRPGKDAADELLAYPQVLDEVTAQLVKVLP